MDAGRRVNAVSGTAVRADPAAYWAELPAPVRAWLTERVVVLGAESTGTTTLAAALARSFGTEWVPEYGRDHSAVRPGRLTAPWHSLEFDLIVDRQIAWEDAARRRAPMPLLICDTDVLATTVWHERYVGPAPVHLRDRAAQHRPSAPWNAYPWSVPERGKTTKLTAVHLNAGVEPLRRVIELMEPRLRVVMLHGGAAHNVWDRLAKRHPRIARRYSPVRTYHTARTTFRSKDPAVREYRRQHLRDAFARAAAELRPDIAT